MRIPTKQTARILLVDDDVTMLESLVETLDKSYEITVAATVYKALEHVHRQQFDVIVTDLVFGGAPHAGGITLIDELRSKGMTVPIIVFTGFSTDRYYSELARLRIFAVIPKVEPQELYDAISKAIDESRQAVGDREESQLLIQMRSLLIEEIDRYAPIKERTLNIPNVGHFELIKPLVGFKRDIELQLQRYPYGQNVFLMMKFRSSNADLGEFIIECLRANGLRGVRADNQEWNLTRNIYNAIAVLYCCKYGIALFDEPEPHQAYSANVAYELGMMHYQNKDCLILKHASLPQMPFDLIKDLYVSYDKDLTVRRIVTSWIRERELH